MSKSERLGLFLTPENDNTTTFKQWRMEMNGEENSNMTKIEDELLRVGALASDAYRLEETIETKAARLSNLENGYSVLASGVYSHAEGENHADQWFTEIGKEVVQIDGKYYLNVTPTTAGIYSYNIDGFLLYLNEAISGNISKAAGYYFYYREDFTADHIIATGVALTLDPAKLVAAKVTSDTPTPYNFDFDTDVIVFGAVAASSGSHCEGFSTSALNTYSHSEGYRAISTGHGAHAEGFHTQAKGRGTHTEGVYCRASGDYAHAEGSKTVATGDDAHAEGYCAKASGKMSHAEGESTEAKHRASHAEGLGTKTSADYQHVCGKYNDNNAEALLIVGNGADDQQRKNALVVKKDGTLLAKGVDLLQRIYDAYPAESVQERQVVYTDCGAEGIPLKQFVGIHEFAYGTYDAFIVRRLGKNLFNPARSVFAEGYTIDKDTGELKESTNYASTRDYLPVLPDTDYVMSGDTVGSTYVLAVAFYDASKGFINRVDKKGSGIQFRTPVNCCYVRYNVQNSRVGSLASRQAMLEIGSEPSSYVPYAVQDFIVDFLGVFGAAVNYSSVDPLLGIVRPHDGDPQVFQPVEITTQLGTNYFFVVEGTGEDDPLIDRTTISMTFRKDPTLAYEKLKLGVVESAT